MKNKETLYTWHGFDASGSPQSGILLAPSLPHARVMLRRRYLHRLSIKPQNQSIKSRQLTMLTRQLATLLAAGVPLLQALQIFMHSLVQPAAKNVAQRLHDSVAQGQPLYLSMQTQTQIFDPLYCNLVQAGETSGTLDTMLLRLADYREQRDTLVSQVRTAAIYPLAVLGTSAALLGVFMVYVVPAFAQMYTQAGAALPLPTQWVVAISQMLVSGWWVFLLCIGAMLLLYGWLRRRRKHYEAFILRWAQAQLRLPVLGILLQKAYSARWAKTASVMLAAGVPLLQALRTVAGSTGSVAYAHATVSMQNSISEGLSLHRSMPANLFDTAAIQMVKIGEESGKLEFMLEKLADLYSAEVSTALQRFGKLIEPVIIIVLGLMIGAIVLALYMPIFQIGQVL